MTNVTIIFNGPLEPKGGPSGYLFNLKESLQLNKIDTISIIAAGKTETKSALIKQKIMQSIKNLIPIPNFIIDGKRKKTYKKILMENEEKIKSSRILHFHNTFDFYYFSKIYNLSRHITVLMSHSPEPPHSELYSVLLSQGMSKKRAKQYAQIQKKIDIFAFNNANYIIFPCEGAVSPYVEFMQSNNINTSKIKYVLTATKPLIPILSASQFKQKYSIPTDKKVICYVGRKNLIKGYDVFCELARSFLNKEDFFFVSAGTGEIKSPTQKNLLDIGWTDDPASLINCCDVVVIPNRETYFDLNLIQALSLNKTIITTNTGGNSWFADKDMNLFYADTNDINSFAKILEDESIYLHNNKNLAIYQKFFTNDSFAINYKKVYSELT